MEAAVAGYAEGVLQSSLGKLGSFLWGEALLVGTVRQDIQFIRDELLTMDAVLQDMRSGQLNHQMKAWMLQVLEVACEAELCTDEFQEKVGIRRGRGFEAALWHSVHFLSTLLPRYRIAKAIQEVKSRAKEVSERRSRYNTAVVPINGIPESASLTGDEEFDQVRYNYLVAEDTLVGMHTAEELKFCMDITKRIGHVNMLVIEGSAGSGKTALARMVYRRRTDNFIQDITHSAWVTVSAQPNVEQVLKEILRQVRTTPLQGNHSEDFNVTQLSEQLHKELQDKRFVIVLDSVSSAEDCGVIKNALLLRRGLLVVTTRQMDVAEECCRGLSDEQRHRYKMQALPEEQIDQLCAKLLSKRRLERSIKGLWEILRGWMVRTCPVPLPLKALCGILAHADMEITCIAKIKVHLNNVNDSFSDQDDKIREILKYCWIDRLPAQLPQCSQDLSNFPEGYPINRKKLIRRWIVKGFINPYGKLSIEEVAECYFNELVSRCLLEPESVHPGGKIRRCLVNYMLKEVITPPVTIPSANPCDNQSQQEQTGESTTVGIGNQQMPNPELTVSNDQLVADSDPAFIQLYNVNLSTSHSIVKRQLISRNPELLTFLDLEGCKGLSNSELNKLCEFVQLRFLSLRNTDVDHLPEKIGNLKLLETLDIRQTKIKKVPNGVVGLNCLRHLLAGHFSKPERTINPFSHARAVQVPVGMNEMRSLETLAHINATRASEILLAVRELTRLKKLGLVIQEKNLNSRPLSISIMMLSSSLRSLSVCDEREADSLDFLQYLCFPPQKLESLNLQGHLGRLPQWIANHIRLTKITLANTLLGSNDIKLLGKIPSLLCLKLYPSSVRESTLMLDKDAFTALQMLVVHCSVIRTIIFEEGAAPNLEVFQWVTFYKRTGDIKGLDKLPKLKDVSLTGSFDLALLIEIHSIVEKHEKKDDQLPLVFNITEKYIQDSTKDETEKETSKNKLNLLGCFEFISPNVLQGAIHNVKHWIASMFASARFSR